MSAYGNLGSDVPSGNCTPYSVTPKSSFYLKEPGFRARKVDNQGEEKSQGTILTINVANSFAASLNISPGNEKKYKAVVGRRVFCWSQQPRRVGVCSEGAQRDLATLCLWGVRSVCRTCLTLEPLGKLIKQLAPSSGDQLSFFISMCKHGITIECKCG